MKKLLLLSISLILFTSCSSDDDNPTILGKWYLYKYTEIINGEQDEVLYTHECSTKKNYVEFLESTYNSVYYNNLCNLDGESTGNYIINGSNLYLDVNDEYKILTLNNNKLILEASLEETDFNGNIITIGRVLIELNRN